MSSLLKKKVHVGKYNIPLLPLLFLILASVAVATAYIVLQFNINMNVQPYPKVTFWQWSTSERTNTFDYSVNIFAGIKTVDENITYGIFNNDSVQHQCYLRINSLSNPANIAKLNITIYNSTNTIFTEEWTAFPTQWEPFTTAANAKYAIGIEITAAASPSGSSTFGIEIKENNP
jgi:hypothetical protein